MIDNIRIVVLGTGEMGAGIARQVLHKQGLQLVGAYGRRAHRAGIDIGRAIGLDADLGMTLSHDLDMLLVETQPNLAIQATCSTVDDALGEITTLVNHGVSVITIAEQIVWPAASAPATAEKLHELAVSNGVAVLGTGVNPGFVMDLLIIALSGVCTDVRSINASRVNDLSPYGPAVLRSQGVGLSIADFEAGLAAGSVVGHYGFPESIAMIAASLGLRIDRVEQRRTAIVTEVRRRTPHVTVQPDHVAGCLHEAIAYRDGLAVITLNHPQQVRPELAGVKTGDHIKIDGTPAIDISGSPEIAGGAATIALAVNMIPRVLNAPPGLHCMADLPVPAALLGDVRLQAAPQTGHG
jgi:4-hydroxy-tetrahydrodipicolinate reductase